jgi:acetyl/propionyl-CoA carboxylase alpha subunit
MNRLTAALAEELLGGTAVVPAMSGSIPDMKRVRDRCLDAGFPVMVGCPPGGAGHG